SSETRRCPSLSITGCGNSWFQYRLGEREGAISHCCTLRRRRCTCVLPASSLCLADCTLRIRDGLAVLQTQRRQRPEASGVESPLPCGGSCGHLTRGLVLTKASNE